jgi:hypothetical protein
MKSISEQHVRTRTTVCVCVCVVHHTRMCRLWSMLTLHTDRPRCRRDRAPCRTCRRATPTDRCRFRAGARRRAEYARSVRVRARVLTMCCVALCAALMMCNAWHRVTHSRRSQCRTARVWRASSLLQARLVVLVQTSSLITHLCCRSLRADTHTHTCHRRHGSARSSDQQRVRRRDAHAAVAVLLRASGVGRRAAALLLLGGGARQWVRCVRCVRCVVACTYVCLCV